MLIVLAASEFFFLTNDWLWFGIHYHSSKKSQRKKLFCFSDDWIWVGGRCNGCSHVDEDDWRWESGDRISLNGSLWLDYDGRRMPWDDVGYVVVVTHTLFVPCNGPVFSYFTCLRSNDVQLMPSTLNSHF